VRAAELLRPVRLQGYVMEPLDLGPRFDPVDLTDHRYSYPLPMDLDWQIMPTLDYYGWEHEDAITGFVAEISRQPFNRHASCRGRSWQGCGSWGRAPPPQAAVCVSTHTVIHSHCDIDHPHGCSCGWGCVPALTPPGMLPPAGTAGAACRWT
jgi:hypothetical protein